MTMTDIDDPLLEIEQRELAEKAEGSFNGFST